MNARHLLLITFSGILCSCGSVAHRMPTVKANAVPVSSFVEHPGEMTEQRHRAPFALIWINPALPAARAHYDSIYIAPIETRHLRAAKTNLSNATGIESRQRPLREICTLMRQSFEDAFRQSPAPRLKLTDAPAPAGVTLQLSLVELNATDTAGNAVQAAVPYGGVLGALTNGNIAIEGKVRDNATGELLFEFADNEHDQMTLVSLRDFKPYEHAKAAIRSWAQQFEELTRTAPSHQVKDSLFFTLDPI